MSNLIRKEDVIDILQEKGIKDPVIKKIKNLPIICTTDKIKEMEEEIREFEIQTGLMRKRTYYNRFVTEIFQKEKGSDLIYPDFDEIYKRYFELLDEYARIIEALEAMADEANDACNAFGVENAAYYDGKEDGIREAIEKAKEGNKKHLKEI